MEQNGPPPPKRSSKPLRVPYSGYPLFTIGFHHQVYNFSCRSTIDDRIYLLYYQTIASFMSNMI